jgi:uncharacterized membrane protein YfcA
MGMFFPLTTALLAAIVVVAQSVETVTGFGGTVLSLSLGAHLIPLDRLVVSLVLVNVIQNMWLVVRGFRHVRLKLLVTRVLPLCGAGLAVGALIFQELGGGGLKPVLGGFVMTVAVLELVRLYRTTARPATLSPWAASAILVGGGLFHGMFASGGPLVVYFASRSIPDKHAFRATLSLLWLVLNAVLIVTFSIGGRIDRSALALAAAILPALLLGILVGELVHRRVDELKFRKLVQGVLLLTGVFLLV